MTTLPEWKDVNGWQAPEDVRIFALSLARGFDTDSFDLNMIYWQNPATYLHAKADSSYFGTGEIHFFTQVFHRYDSPIEVMWEELNNYFMAREAREPRAELIIDSLIDKVYEKGKTNLDRYWTMLWKGHPRYHYAKAIEEGYRKEGKRSPTQEQMAEIWGRFIASAKELGDILESYPFYTIESVREYQRALSVTMKPPTREQIAGGLTHLPRYHCHCKLSQGTQSFEVTLKTQQIGLSGDVADIDEIRMRNRIKYAMPMDDAITEMNERQARYWTGTEMLFDVDEPPPRGAID